MRRRASTPLIATAPRAGRRRRRAKPPMDPPMGERWRMPVRRAGAKARPTRCAATSARHATIRRAVPAAPLPASPLAGGRSLIAGREFSSGFLDSRFRGNDGSSAPRLAPSRQWPAPGRHSPAFAGAGSASTGRHSRIVPRHSRIVPRHSRIIPRHSRESGNPFRSIPPGAPGFEIFGVCRAACDTGRLRAARRFITCRARKATRNARDRGPSRPCVSPRPAVRKSYYVYMTARTPRRD